MRTNKFFLATSSDLIEDRTRLEDSALMKEIKLQQGHKTGN